MKKFLMIILGLFLVGPFTVNAASLPDATSYPGFFVANGTAIEINARDDGQEGAKITWEGGEVKVPADIAIVGGGVSGTSYETSNITMNGGTVAYIYGGGSSLGVNAASADVTTTNIVMNGGKVKTIVGGGVLNSRVTTANITINNGSFKEVNGGGSASTTNSGSVGNENDLANSPCRVETTNVKINGGSTTAYSYGIVFGGGQGYSYTGTANLTIGGTADLSNSWVTAAGSNGRTNVANMTINGGKLNIVQSINRGEVTSAATTITGGTIENLYLGGEGDPNVDATANSLSLAITGGKIKSLSAGTVGGVAIDTVNQSNSSFKIAYLEGTVTNDTTNAAAYEVIVNPNITHGTVRATIKMLNNIPTAVVTIIPDEGYVLEMLTAKDINNNDMQVDGMNITLTTAKTTINATFKIDTSKDSVASNPSTFVTVNIILEIIAIIIGLSTIVFTIIKKNKSTI